MNLNPKYVRLNPASRLYNLGIPVIGLTGGISTGKSSVAKILSDHGLPVINADHLVKDVYRSWRKILD
jgi:dephospho-CoA kinase